MKSRIIGAVLGVALFGLGIPASANPTGDAGDSIYADTDKWLCLPGREDTCDQDLATTVVAADGTMTLEPFDPPADAPVDCFYIYPTISLDQGANADWDEGPEEGRVIQQQLARFAEIHQSPS